MLSQTWSHQWCPTARATVCNKCYYISVTECHLLLISQQQCLLQLQPLVAVSVEGTPIHLHVSSPPAPSFCIWTSWWLYDDRCLLFFMSVRFLASSEDPTSPPSQRRRGQDSSTGDLMPMPTSPATDILSPAAPQDTSLLSSPRPSGMTCLSCCGLVDSSLDS